MEHDYRVTIEPLTAQAVENLKENRIYECNAFIGLFGATDESIADTNELDVQSTIIGTGRDTARSFICFMDHLPVGFSSAVVAALTDQRLEQDKRAEMLGHDQ